MKQVLPLIQAQFDIMCATGKLFQSSVSGNEIIDAYLKGFGEDPIFRDPQSSVHNCNMCKNFLHRYGNIVAVDENLDIIMITEDYVSFETAKLLKEKGFDDNCAALYDLRSGELNQRGVGYVFNNGQWDNFITAPTLQMAMKWLREVHNLHIDVDPSEGNWNPTVLELENWTCAVKFGDNIPIQDSYEEACEAAIKYCLENLI